MRLLRPFLFPVRPPLRQGLRSPGRALRPVRAMKVRPRETHNDLGGDAFARNHKDIKPFVRQFFKESRRVTQVSGDETELNEKKKVHNTLYQNVPDFGPMQATIPLIRAPP